MLLVVEVQLIHRPGVLRIELQSIHERLQCLRVPALLAIEPSQLIVHGGLCRRARACGFERHDGAGRIAARALHQAEGVSGMRQLGIGLYGARQQLAGGLLIAQLALRRAKVVQLDAAARLQFQSSFERRQCLLEADTTFELCHAFIAQPCQLLRRVGQRRVFVHLPARCTGEQ
jgi:hypothetical protein